VKLVNFRDDGVGSFKEGNAIGSNFDTGGEGGNDETKAEADALRRREGDPVVTSRPLVLFGEGLLTTMLAWEFFAFGVDGIETEAADRSESVRSILERIDELR